MHLLFWIYVAVLLLGSAAVSNALVSWRRHRRAASLPFASLLAGTALIVLGMALQHYRGIVAPAVELPFGLASFVSVLVGCATVVWSIPPTVATLRGDLVGGRTRTLLLAPGTVFVLVSAGLLFWPSSRAISVVLNVLLFATTGCGFLALAFGYRRTIDVRIRAGLRDFFVAVVVVAPLLYADSVSDWMPPARVLSALDGATMPLSAAIVFVLAMRFTRRFLLEPPYRDSQGLTEHFTERYALAHPEQQLVDLLVQGASDRDLVEQTEYTGRVVERALGSVLEKTGAGDRSALVRLVNENRAG